jgi:PAS domain S-box-containing protein
MIINNSKSNIDKSEKKSDPDKIETGILMDAYFQLKNVTNELAIKNRALKLLSEINQSLVYSVDEKTLLSQVCQTIVSHGGYQSVWVGLIPSNNIKTIFPVSCSGLEHKYLKSLQLFWNDSLHERGPEAAAVRSGEPVIKHNISKDPDIQLCKEVILKQGYQSLIAMPLKYKSKKLGVLVIYSNKENAFDAIEVNILKELADDLAFGISSRRLIIEHNLLEEELLKASADRYKALFISSRDAIMTLEPPSWKFTSGNPSTLKIFGIKEEGEFLKLDPFELSPDLQSNGRKSIEMAREMIDIAMIYGTNFFEWTHKRITGEEFPAEVSLSRVKMNGHKFIHAVVRDITDRKKLENELKEYADQKFKKIFDVTNDGMIIADTKTKKFFFGNRAIHEMLGYESEEFNKLSVYDIHPKEYLDSVLVQFIKQSNGELKIAKDLPVLRKNKSIFYADVSASEIFLEGNKYILGVFRDTTERKISEEFLRESEEKYFNLIENIPDAITVYDSKGKIVFINRESLRLLGAKNDDELIGESVMKFIHPDSLAFVSERIKKSINEKKILEIAEEKFLRIDGSVVIVEVKSMPIKFDNKQAVLVIIRDITERKNLEESKISFLSIASHQLRTPLSMMKWVLESLADDGSYKPTQQKKINNLIYSNEKLINLVEKLLKAAMIESGEMIAKKTAINLENLINETVLSLREFANKNSKSIEIITKPNISSVYCDPVLVNESIKNLLTNAIIYSQINSSKITITAIEREKDYYISVHNEGSIDPTSLKKISSFEKFSRCSQSQKISPSGSGLGLYITKKMVEVNGGLLGFESNEMIGTIFHFTINKKNI